MNRLLALVFVVLLSVPAFANFPKNNLHLQDGRIRGNGMTEQQFNQIVDAVINMWQPLAKLHGAQLVAIKKWTDPTVNAYAQQSNGGKTWEVDMFGGLARRPEVTLDGFALVVCHELGHHFGGYYFYGQGNWASAEGQADYFATDVCAKRIFAAFNQRNPIFRQQVPPYVKERCDTTWTTQPLRDLCYRSSAGGLSLANLLSVLGGEKTPPHFETPDPRKVSTTNTAHPAAQCRLDTYFQGALCGAAFDLQVIPGKGQRGGSNTKEAEAMAAKYSCTAAGKQSLGLRPACWFKELNAGMTYNFGGRR